MTFEQTDTDGYFTLYKAETYAEPDPPQVGTTLNVHLTGRWETTLTLNHIDTDMHNTVQHDSYSNGDVQNVSGGEDWSILLQYDIPNIAIVGQWDLVIQQFDMSGTNVFTVTSGWYWP